MPTGKIEDPALAQQLLDALDALRVAWLGKTGHLTEQLKQLGKLAPEQPDGRLVGFLDVEPF